MDRGEKNKSKQFTVHRLMVAVAVVAVICLGAAEVSAALKVGLHRALAVAATSIAVLALVLLALSPKE